MKICIEMAKLATLQILLPFLSVSVFAQIGIGTSTPDASAILHVEANDKGLLVPRSSDGNNITNPANGLLFFNTSLNTLQYNKGTHDEVNWETFNLTTSTIRQFSATKYSYNAPSVRLRPNPNYDNINYSYRGTGIGTVAHYLTIQDNMLFTNDTDTEDLLYNNFLSFVFVVNEDGRYRITINLSTYIPTGRYGIYSGNDRTGLRNIGLNLEVNGYARGTCSLDFAVRTEEPYDDIVRKEQTAHRLTEVLELNANDEIRVRIFNTYDVTSGEDRPMFLAQEDDINSFFIEKLR